MNDFIIKNFKEVPYFPKSLKDLASFDNKIFSANKELVSDHPGFHDEVYKKRREEIAEISKKFKFNGVYPTIKYTEQENATWNTMWNVLTPLHRKYACKEHNENMKILSKEINFNEKSIPQIGDISNFLKKNTGFIYAPAVGMLSQREFFNSLAFRVFRSTQYIRHHSLPLYTPEPDLIHEYLGHTPLFLNRDFCDFSQEIGLASLGASDEEIKKLGSIYMFSVEFGHCMEGNLKKIYGAGNLSSPSEIEWAASNKPRFHEFQIEKMINTPYYLSEMQKDYFVVRSIALTKKIVRNYINNTNKPFNFGYDSESESLRINAVF